MKKYSLFNREVTLSSGTSNFARKRILSLLPDGTKLPPAKSCEVYSVLALDYDSGTGQLFAPEPGYLIYVLDVELSSYPVLYTKMDDPTHAEVFSVIKPKEQTLIYPDALSTVLLGPQPGLSEQEVRDALLPHVESILYYSPHFIEVESAPFRERELATHLETTLPQVVRYAETSFVQRRIYSPGWFARKLL